MSRWRSVLLVGAALLFAGAAVGRSMAIKHAESAIRDRGFTWERTTAGILTVRWEGIQGSGIRADALVARLDWPVQVIIESPDADLLEASLEHLGQQSDTAASSRSSIPVQLSVKDMSVSWGDRALLTELSGPLTPMPNLNGPTGHVSVRKTSDGRTEIHGEADLDLELPHLKGTGRVTLTKGDMWTITLDLPNAVFQHDIIAREPLPPTAFTSTATWHPDTHALEVEGEVGRIPWKASGVFDLQTADLSIEIPLVDMKTVVELFGPLIPESDQAGINGQVGLSGTLKGPDWVWTAEPAVDDLRVTGALPPTFGGHDIQWKVRTDDGSLTYGSTGPGTPGWVQHDAAGWMPAAVVAAEDIRFHSHPGYDLVAIQEALQAAPDEERIRGGSTITQQLAKNLFLDGRRTFCRKLRELLIAMSLEKRMSKEAILTLYLNIVEFGPGIYGVGNAADAWFIKRPSGLTPREAAFLASILPAPRMWHERISRTGTVPVRRVNEVLSRMGRRGDLTRPQLARAQQVTLRVVPP